MKTAQQTSLVALLAIFSVGASAQSHELGQHPAILIQQQAAHIDPNTFIVAPPVHVTWTAGHANHEHPAVVIARLAAEGRKLDPNTFLVQPPATTAWTVVPDTLPADRVALAERR